MHKSENLGIVSDICAYLPNEVPCMCTATKWTARTSLCGPATVLLPIQGVQVSETSFFSAQKKKEKEKVF